MKAMKQEIDRFAFTRSPYGQSSMVELRKGSHFVVPYRTLDAVGVGRGESFP